MRDGYLPVLRANNIVSGELKFDNLVFVPNERIAPVQQVKMGDIVMATSSGSKAVIGKTALAVDDWQGGFGAFCKVIRPKETIDQVYLSYFFRSPGYRSVISNAVNGSNINNIRNAHIDELNIPLLSLMRQNKSPTSYRRRIRRDSSGKQPMRLPSSFCRALFFPSSATLCGMRRVGKKKPVGELSTSKLGKMLDAQSSTGENLYPYLGNASVRWHSFELDNLKEMEFDEAERQKFSLKSGDILMCEGGEIGRCAIWCESNRNIYFQKALHRIRLKPDVNNEYFVWLMFFYGKRGGFQGMKLSVTIAHLTGEKLKELLIPIPPLKLQQKFVNIVAQTEAVRQKQRAHAEELEEMFQGLLQRYFG